MTLREELVLDLRGSRMEVMLRGHSWDIADVMEVIDSHLGDLERIQTRIRTHD